MVSLVKDSKHMINKRCWGGCKEIINKTGWWGGGRILLTISFLEISESHFSFFPSVNPVLGLCPKQAGSKPLEDLSMFGRVEKRAT